MSRKRNVKFFCGDTESTTPRILKHDERFFVEHLDSVRVWGAGLCEIGSTDVQLFNDLDDFMRVLDTLECDGVVYFHNLKWDAQFLLSWFASHGFEFDDMENRTFKDVCEVHHVNSLIDGNGSFFSVSFTNSKNRLIEFRDSLKILPFSVEVIGKKFGSFEKLTGTVDYSKPRPHGYVMDSIEEAYLRNDILVVCNALHILSERFDGILDVLTIGSYSMRHFKSLFAGNYRTRKKTFDDLFPQIINDKFFRDAYKGGWCYCDERYKDKPLFNVDGHVYDVNSLYPSVMYNGVFPRGEPKKWKKSLDDLCNSDYPYFVKFETEFTLKPNKLPFLQEKAGFFRETSHIKDSDGVRILTLSRPDFELFKECYEYDYFQIIDMFFFPKSCSPFKQYIDYWSEIKTKASKSGDEVMRTFR